MGLLEFNKLPINTLVGADWKTFKDITGGRDIGAAYKGKYRLTKAVCRLLSTLAPLQDRRYEKLLADKPLAYSASVTAFEKAKRSLTPGPSGGAKRSIIGPSDSQASRPWIQRKAQ